MKKKNENEVERMKLLLGFLSIWLVVIAIMCVISKTLRRKVVGRGESEIQT